MPYVLQGFSAVGTSSLWQLKGLPCWSPPVRDHCLALPTSGVQKQFHTFCPAFYWLWQKGSS